MSWGLRALVRNLLFKASLGSSFETSQELKSTVKCTLDNCPYPGFNDPISHADPSDNTDFIYTACSSSWQNVQRSASLSQRNLRLLNDVMEKESRVADLVADLFWLNYLRIYGVKYASEKTEDEDNLSFRAVLEDVFNEADDDGSGGVDAQELSHVLHRLGVTLPVHCCADLIAIVDDNNNGSMEITEFLEMMCVRIISDCSRKTLNEDIAKYERRASSHFIKIFSPFKFDLRTRDAIIPVFAETMCDAVRYCFHGVFGYFSIDTATNETIERNVLQKFTGVRQPQQHGKLSPRTPATTLRQRCVPHRAASPIGGSTPERQRVAMVPTPPTQPPGSPRAATATPTRSASAAANATRRRVQMQLRSVSAIKRNYSTAVQTRIEKKEAQAAKVADEQRDLVEQLCDIRSARRRQLEANERLAADFGSGTPATTEIVDLAQSPGFLLHGKQKPRPYNDNVAKRISRPPVPRINISLHSQTLRDVTSTTPRPTHQLRQLQPEHLSKEYRPGIFSQRAGYVGEWRAGSAEFAQWEQECQLQGIAESARESQRQRQSAATGAYSSARIAHKYFKDSYQQIKRDEDAKRRAVLQTISRVRSEYALLARTVEEQAAMTKSAAPHAAVDPAATSTNRADPRALHERYNRLLLHPSLHLVKSDTRELLREESIELAKFVAQLAREERFARTQLVAHDMFWTGAQGNATKKDEAKAQPDVFGEYMKM